MSTADPLMLTISHQYGSGGSQIARDLGSRLEWSVWDKEIVRKIATEYQLAETDVEAKDERVASFIERLVEILGWSCPESGGKEKWRILPVGKVHDQRAALQGGHRRNTPWARVARKKRGRRSLSPSRSAN